MGQTDLLQAFTRVGNMIKDATDTTVDPALFETEEEKALYAACQAMSRKKQIVPPILAAIKELR